MLSFITDVEYVKGMLPAPNSPKFVRTERSMVCAWRCVCDVLCLCSLSGCPDLRRFDIIEATFLPSAVHCTVTEYMHDDPCTCKRVYQSCCWCFVVVIRFVFSIEFTIFKICYGRVNAWMLMRMYAARMWQILLLLFGGTNKLKRNDYKNGTQQKEQKTRNNLNEMSLRCAIEECEMQRSQIKTIYVRRSTVSAQNKNRTNLLFLLVAFIVLLLSRTNARANDSANKAKIKFA